MSDVYYFNMTSVDKKPFSERVQLSSLKVKTYQDISKKREIIFWFNREDVPNPENIINPGMRMYLRKVDEVAPNKFLVRDGENRTYKLELLYVE